jgi:beta-glucosidase-like glycosyl hydrolase
MPGAGWMNQKKIGAQLSAGVIDQSVIDDSVLRILTTMYKFGVMDKYAQWDAKKLLTNVTTEASVQMARYLSTQSHVLIKNQDNLLPLPKKLTKKVAVLGLADSSNCLVHGGGSGSGAASVASFQAAVLTDIYLRNVCSCHEILRRNGRG